MLDDPVLSLDDALIQIGFRRELVWNSLSR